MLPGRKQAEYRAGAAPLLTPGAPRKVADAGTIGTAADCEELSDGTMLTCEHARRPADVLPEPAGMAALWCAHRHRARLVDYARCLLTRASLWNPSPLSQKDGYGECLLARSQAAAWLRKVRRNLWGVTPLIRVKCVRSLWADPRP
jgi:hypothetical protein